MRDRSGIPEAYRARMANVRVNTSGKGATRPFPSCTRSDHKAHQPQISVVCGSAGPWRWEEPKETPSSPCFPGEETLPRPMEETDLLT